MATDVLMKCHYDENEKVWITPKGRSNFVALVRKFKSKKSTRKDDEGQFAISLIFPPGADLSGLKNACNEVAREKWAGVDLFSPGKNKGKKSPMLRADEKLADITSKDQPVDLDGWTMLRANAFQKRPVVRNSKGEVIELDDLDIEAYSGRWMRIMVRPAAYSNESDGVKLWLEGVQLLTHDDRIGGFAVTTGEAFGAVDDEDDEV